ncbi:sensor histidine kinase [Paenisporosarcina cavernae]|uniref:Signal transduction histidine-protein kinase ArlS n=1 Tax=Paenisporosarcina cavernae TaxID=2320858 RepID=A0A385YT18_9BACL|nr:HAMP domain-containing histidine kinase [Paenisporosarcina cavernae]AYC29460.1 sensor histidine kinase [Paenisporosarcina cavernae]
MKQRLNDYWSSLQTRWSIITASIMVSIFLLLSLTMFFSMKAWLLEKEKQNTNATMNELVQFFESKGPFLTISDIRSNRTLMSSIIEKKQSVRLLNSDGIELLRINDVESFSPIPLKRVPDNGFLLEQSTLKDRHYLHAFGKVQLGNYPFYLQLQHPLDDFVASTSYMLGMLVLFTLIALIGTFIVSFFLSRLLIQPILDLKSEMVNVRLNGLTENIQLKSTTREMNELYDQFTLMTDKLKESFDNQTQFLADASHELRTPLQVLEGHIGLLSRWGKNDPKIIDESLDISLKEIEHMKTLLNEMMLLSREDSPVISYQDVDIDSLLLHLQQELKTVFPASQFTYTPIIATVKVSLTEVALHQLLRNLIVNGLIYNKNATPMVHVTPTIEKYGVRISVKDNGVGLTEEQQKKVFNRFYRVDDSRNKRKEGSGLGLSIVKSFLIKNGGDISISESSPSGTTFEIHLPLYDVFYSSKEDGSPNSPKKE